MKIIQKNKHYRFHWKEQVFLSNWILEEVQPNLERMIIEKFTFPRLKNACWTRITFLLLLFYLTYVLFPQNAKMLFEQTTRWKTSKTENANFGTFSRFYFFTSIQENVCLSGLRTKLPDIKFQYFKYPPK